MQAALSSAAAAASPGLHSDADAVEPPMRQRPLGKTGLSVSAVGFGGGSRFWEQVEGADQAVELIQEAVKLGINFFDTAGAYGENGEGEKYMGEGLEPHREDVIIATKSRARDYDGTKRAVETSLKNLRTDRIDLYQIHNLAKETEIEQLLAKDGGLKAVRELKKEGVIKHFGITSHTRAKILMTGIRRLDPDTVCFPTNAAEVTKYEYVLIPYAQSRGLGVIGMKATGQRQLLGRARAADLVAYALSLSISTLLVGIDNKDTLRSCVNLALGRPMSSKERNILRKRISCAGTEIQLPHHNPNYMDGYIV